MKHLLSLFFLFLLSAPACALDHADQGVYQLINQKGTRTDMFSRLIKGPDRWRLEARQPDGSWEDVTCEAACALADSTPEDVTGFLAETPLAGTDMSCVHDSAFAFCREGSGTSSSYYMLAFSNGKVIPVSWARVGDLQGLSSAP